jgi:uncharacterized membrane protein
VQRREPDGMLTVLKFDTADGAQNALAALFATTQDAVTDRVVDNFRGTRAELITTNLSADQEAKLREAFEDADHAPV